jgi:1-deoxy-D-xylulose-5-phosphate reductoisomerase
VLNAANEIAVAAFLQDRVGFLEIAAIVSETLELMDKSGELRGEGGGLEDAFAVHGRAQSAARTLVADRRSPRRSGGRMI